MPATPSSVMYTDLKNFGRISNQSAAELLLSDLSEQGRISPRSRVKSDRSYLSREIVHANPKVTHPDRFADIPQATLTLASRIMSSAVGEAQVTRGELTEHYRHEAAERMCEALDAAGFDATLYRNALDKLAHAQLNSERSRGVLYLMLFVATGCLGDPASAVPLVEDFATNKLTASLHTTEVDVGAAFDTTQGSKPVELGLLRMVDGAVKAPLHVLSTSPEGTVIGALATGADDISDVDRDVSRQHLRIWRKNGHWYAQGLGSTNGTTVISGDTRKTEVIEPTRAARLQGASYPPVEILNSDVLCLGATTRFLVMRITS